MNKINLTEGHLYALIFILGISFLVNSIMITNARTRRTADDIIKINSAVLPLTLDERMNKCVHDAYDSHQDSKDYCYKLITQPNGN